MFKDFLSYVRLVDEADDPHFSLALGAGNGLMYGRGSILDPIYGQFGEVIALAWISGILHVLVVTLLLCIFPGSFIVWAVLRHLRYQKMIAKALELISIRLDLKP